MASTLNKDLTPWLELFQVAGDRRNFSVVVEDQTLFVNKMAFGACSPVLEAAISGDFKEARENQFKFPDKTLNQVLEMFACLFALPDLSRKEITEKNFSLLWDLANEYLIEVCRHIL